MPSYSANATGIGATRAARNNSTTAEKTLLLTAHRAIYACGAARLSTSIDRFAAKCWTWCGPKSSYFQPHTVPPFSVRRTYTHTWWWRFWFSTTDKSTRARYGNATRILTKRLRYAQRFVVKSTFSNSLCKRRRTGPHALGQAARKGKLLGDLDATAGRWNAGTVLSKQTRLRSCLFANSDRAPV